MKNMKFTIPLGLALTLLAFTAHADVTRYNGSPRGSKVRVEGTSTFHDWEMEGTIIAGFIEFPVGINLDPAQTTIPDLAVKAQASIPVRSVTSNKPTMDGLMQETMNEKQFKKIEYKLTDLKFKAPHETGKPFDFDATGELTIAGSTNKITFPITIERIGIDRLKIAGTTSLKMTTYGIKPPAPNIGLGLMKCGDDLKIIFEWSLTEKK